MQFTLRQKIFAIFSILLLIAVFIGILSIDRFNRLGKSIDVILRENYRSVIACQQMNEALERIDSGLLFIQSGYENDGRVLVEKNIQNFNNALNAELNNLTLPDEPKEAYKLKSLFTRYSQEIPLMKEGPEQVTALKAAYFKTLFPLFHEIKETTGNILHMNQQNMNDANNRARRQAARARRDMVLFLGIAFFLTTGFLVFSNRWILKPIQRLIRSAYEITNGNLNLVIKVDTQDEIGHLSEAFNAMIAYLRLLKRSDDSRIERIQRSTQEAFRNLPQAIAIIDPDGTIELSTHSARSDFGLAPGSKISEIPPIPSPWLSNIFSMAIKNKKMSSQEFEGEIIQHFINNQEKFFQPKAFLILDSRGETNGIIVSLEDVTLKRADDEVKKDLYSTVSHQLKTPLTSIRMVLHLLLEEKIGSLNEKQADLLVSARDESERIFTIIEDLLDISRIESGNIKMNMLSLSPYELIHEIISTFERDAQDKRIMIETDIPEDLPNVAADPSRIYHAIGNLISNAVKYTPAGGNITVTLTADADNVHFYVSDNGPGIPKEYQSKIFRKFFRIPGRNTESGEGLGLAIAKEIINAHQGEISFQSTEGKGTTFHFTLKPYANFLLSNEEK